ncbi:MAG: metallophosphoesterase [Planctomycetota bacterium]|jgi:predicted phosphohydrolase
MNLFAISDLHLSFGVEKPMDIFGPQWVGHADKMREAWDAEISDEDWVLVGGDISWGLNLAEAQPDLDWLGERPGTKILIKGNHCTWWSSRKKVEQAIDSSILLLQNNAIKMADGTVVIGSRLWDPPGAPWADEQAAKIFSREVGRLKLSVDAGKKLGGERLIALVHYPPRYTDGRTTDAVPVLEDAGVSHCIYGHLHGKDHVHGFQGEAGGIRYFLTSCDAIDFKPLRIELN